MSWASLAAALAHAPNLAGCQCRGRSQLFDLQPFRSAEAAMREAQALELCANCVVLLQCKRHFDSMPLSVQPYGVIAGRVHRPSEDVGVYGRPIGRPREKQHEQSSTA